VRVERREDRKAATSSTSNLTALAAKFAASAAVYSSPVKMSKETCFVIVWAVQCTLRGREKLAYYQYPSTESVRETYIWYLFGEHCW
jgi:hypothetical protein